MKSFILAFRFISLLAIGCILVDFGMTKYDTHIYLVFVSVLCYGTLSYAAGIMDK